VVNVLIAPCNGSNIYAVEFDAIATTFRIDEVVREHGAMLLRQRQRIIDRHLQGVRDSRFRCRGGAG
jgi:hypothetical protein